MKTLSLAGCLLSCALCTTAQTKIEFSSWIPERTNPSKLNRIGYSVITTDKDSLVTEVLEYIGDMLDNRKRYVYNEKKQKLNETSYTYKGATTWVKHFTYNEIGKVAEVNYSYVDKAGITIDIKETYGYDDRKRVNLETRSSSGLPGTETWEYVYDADKDGNLVITRFKATKHKRKIEVVSTFNAKNLLIKEFRKNYHGNGPATFTYEYTYNESGDWTSRKMYEQHRLASPELKMDYRKTRLD